MAECEEKYRQMLEDGEIRYKQKKDKIKQTYRAKMRTIEHEIASMKAASRYIFQVLFAFFFGRL